MDNTAVAAKVGVNQATVGKWRRRFVVKRLDGLVDEPRPGAPRTITDEDVERVVVTTLEDKPVDATHWSTRDLARQVGMSPASVGRIWQAFGLKPWQTDTFKLSEDPLCVEEKSGIQALDRTQPVLPMRPGQVERRTHDYKRNGVVDLFAALNLATGEVLHHLRPQHRAVEFKKFLIAIDKAVPAGLDVHLVLDNSSTHKTPAIHTWLLRHPRFHLHFTPTSSSWLNLVERWFAELTRRLLKRSAHKSLKALTSDLTTWVAHWNDNPRPFVWHKTADEILDTLSKYLQRTSEAGH
jgi:transposase